FSHCCRPGHKFTADAGPGFARIRDLQRRAGPDFLQRPIFRRRVNKIFNVSSLLEVINSHFFALSDRSGTSIVENLVHTFRKNALL
ncbi:MAG: hypothetical protein VZQ84_02270, partial [Anaerovoracaceae bacterium]|nr:hypothetical protein [Anaerovoracaceae bacterium]